jgi:hypothetical protein
MHYHEHWIDQAITLAAKAETEQELLHRLHEAGVSDHDRDVFEHTLRLMHRARHALRSPWAAGNCLDDNTLAEFVDGVLAREERLLAEQHLACCNACLHNAAHLAELAAELAPTQPMLQVVLGVARRGLELLQRPLEGFMEQTLQPAMVLGAETQTPAARGWTLSAEGVDAEFLAVADDDAIAVTVQVNREGAPISKSRITLRSEEILMESCPMPATGRLTFYQLSPGRYSIEITPEGGRPVEFALQLKPIDENETEA